MSILIKDSKINCGLPKRARRCATCPKRALRFPLPSFALTSYGGQAGDTDSFLTQITLFSASDVFLTKLFRKASFVKSIVFAHYANFVITLSLDRPGRKARIFLMMIAMVVPEHISICVCTYIVVQQSKFLGHGFNSSLVNSI
jgi:hypothetical protein